MKNYFFTSESVTEGHPDKVADLISDNVANYLINQNESHRAAIETMVSSNMVTIAGEVKTDLMNNANSIEDLKDIGNLLIQKVDKGIGVLGADLEKPSIVVVVSNALVDIGVHAGMIAKDLGSMMGGGGGGRPNMATAGGKNKKSLNSALEKAQDVIKKNLEGKNAV